MCQKLEVWERRSRPFPLTLNTDRTCVAVFFENGSGKNLISSAKFETLELLSKKNYWCKGSHWG